MKQHTVRLHPLGKTLRVNDQTPLIDILHEYGIEFPCGGRGTCGKCRVRLLEGSVETTPSHREKLMKLNLPEGWLLACYSRCTGDVTLEIDQLNHFILADESEFPFRPGKGYGVAVDLGTTTLVAQLTDLSSARVVAVETMLNPQVRYGADLISRIQACLDGHSEEMTRLIRESTGTMISRMLVRHRVDLKRISIVGNTAMALIFSGRDVTPLASYPFEVPPGQEIRFPAEAIGWNLHVDEGITFHSHIAGFVGSDILAGIAATGLHRNQEITALIDLGTNGEIVVGNRDRIVCASTAAGPAFEGSNISMGMRAVTGAISSLSLVNDHFEAVVVGNATPRGICGSALIDAVALLKKTDRIGMFGEILTGEHQLNLTGKVYLNQKDIHEFLLAKAAIAAGLEILCNHLRIGIDGISRIYIAGGFGHFINLDHISATGMIGISAEKIHKMGNTALIGAKMFLFEDAPFREEILGITQHIHLESDPEFQNIYVDKMLLL